MYGTFSGVKMLTGINAIYITLRGVLNGIIFALMKAVVHVKIIRPMRTYHGCQKAIGA